MSGSGGPVRVLHVDDDAEFATLASTFLEREDDRFDVVTAHDADDGMEHLESGTYDCVVSDYEMPGRNGIEFLSAVREHHPDLPFILFTGRGSEAVASDAISAGVTDYLQKEVGTDQYALLANKVRNAVERTRAERARQRHLEAIETAQEGISILNEAGEFIYVNERYADLYGYDPEEMLGEHWELTYPDGDVEFAREEILPTVKASGVWRGKTTGLRSDDTTFVEEHVVSETEHGDLVCTVRDVTETERREAELRRKTRAMDEAPVGITITDPSRPDNPVIYANERFLELTGYDEDEIVGENCRLLQGPDTDPEAVEELRRAIEAGEPTSVDLLNYRRDGSAFRNRVAIAPVHDDGELTNWVGFQRDVTEERARERAIADLHATARELMAAETRQGVAESTVAAVHEVLDFPAVGVHFYDAESNTLPPAAWGERTEELLGEPRPFAPGDLAWRAFEDGEARVYDDLTDYPEYFDHEPVNRSAMVLPLDGYGIMLVGSPDPGTFDDTDVSLAQTLSAHATTALDVIDREAELRRYERIVNTMQEAACIYDEEGRIELANEYLADFNGTSPANLEGRDSALIDRLRERAPDGEDPFRELFTGERSRIHAEIEYEHPDHGHTVVDARLSPLSVDGEVESVVGVARDVTEHRTRERELERYETIVESSGDPVYTLDADGRITFVDDRMVAFTGYEESELLGAHVSKVIDGRDNDRGRDLIRSLLEDGDGHRTVEMDTITADGERIPCENHIAILPFDDEEGFRGTTGLLRDISERKARERELERRNQRLDEFASVVSHDLKNPLSVARGQLELAREEGDDEHLQAVADAIDRSQVLVDDLLTLAREGDRVVDPQSIELAALVEESWESLENEDARLVVDAERSIEADETLFRQLVENLLRDAIEHGTGAAAGDDPTVTVTVGDLSDGFYVADDGPGVPEDDRDRVFDAGYSAANGAGLGLTIVKRVAEAHGWDVALTESESGGARFEITGVGEAGAAAR